MKTNVLIVGKGISGILLSVLLKKHGISSIVLNKTTTSAPIILAETIPPSTLTLLKDCKLLDTFEKTATKTYGYQSIWNNEFVDQSFFAMNPFKYGLKIEKNKLLKELSSEVQDQIIGYNKLVQLTLNTDTVITQVKEGKKELQIESDLIVDATGRKRQVLKHAGISSINYDDTLAFICYLPKTGPDLKYGFFTEAFAGAWGTLSDLNETTRILSLYASKKNKLHQSFRDYSQWRKILAQTKVLKLALPEQGNFKVYGKQANSSVPSKIAFNNILSIGDAAIAFDPISSHGISNAIYTAKEASTTIKKYLIGDVNSFSEYEENMYNIFNEYLKQKEKLYQVKYH